jgi:hypothetical protein
MHYTCDVPGNLASVTHQAGKVVQYTYDAAKRDPDRAPRPVAVRLGRTTTDRESAACSLHEGAKEMFTLQRLKIHESLHKCLATTNIIESPQSGVERRTRKVSRWRDAAMAQRWVASAWLLTEKHFRRIGGHADLWALAAILGRENKSTTQPSKRK